MKRANNWTGPVNTQDNKEPHRVKILDPQAPTGTRLALNQGSLPPTSNPKPKAISTIYIRLRTAVPKSDVRLRHMGKVIQNLRQRPKGDLDNSIQVAIFGPTGQPLDRRLVSSKDQFGDLGFDVVSTGSLVNRSCICTGRHNTNTVREKQVSGDLGKTLSTKLLVLCRMRLLYGDSPGKPLCVLLPMVSHQTPHRYGTTERTHT